MIHIDQRFIREISDKAVQSQRQRINYNFHKELSDTLQRMLNAMEPRTYVQPHRHEDPDKREVFIILTGRILVIEYNDDGEIIDHIILDRNEGNYGVEIEAGSWHSLISLKSGSAVYELKDGPYHKDDDKNFAEWAPAEGDEGAQTFNQQILDRLNISN